jgi:nucleoside-diphosphate-sugar epimerase
MEDVETFVGDINDPIALRKASEGLTSIVHAAGLAHVFGAGAWDSDEFDKVNEVGTANVIEAAIEAGVPHVVLVSSASVYGSYPGAMCDETVPCHPRGVKRSGDMFPDWNSLASPENCRGDLPHHGRSWVPRPQVAEVYS